jgi:DNA-directed RNA polymerase subunit RPC12/RpoP
MNRNNCSKKMHKEVRNNTVYCKHCGHSLAFLNKRATDKVICSHCGYWIYRNDFAEFQDKLKISMLKGDNNDIQNK